MYAVASTSASAGRFSFFDDLVRCETRLYNALETKLRAGHGIAASQFEFLRYLRDHPETRVIDVSTNFAAGIGAISKGMDRLESRGWIVRLPNPADRRSSLINLTSSGAEVLAAAEQACQELLADLIGPSLTPEQLAAAGAALAALRRGLEEARAGIPVG